MQTEDRVNLIVVGGGAAGLAAAAAAEARGLSAQVLEARDRLGGRVLTTPCGAGEQFDHGAQMVNADMAQVLALAEAAGLHCSPIAEAGASLTVIGDEVDRDDERLTAEELYEMLEESIVTWGTAGEQVEAVGKHLAWWTTQWESPVEAWRWLRWRLRRSDVPGGSVAGALEALLLDRADESLARSMITEAYSEAPEALCAQALHRGMRRETSERGEMEFHFAGGMGAIIAHLASTLSRPPKLRTAVSGITVGADGVEVATACGTMRADGVIVTAPPPAARRIEVSVDAGDLLSRLLSSFQSGAAIKMQLSYATAFWRYRGLSGHAVLTQPAGLTVVDTSLDTGALPRLTAFLGGPEARVWALLTPGDRCARVLGLLSRAFGPAAETPIRTAEAVWHDDRWSGGGYNATVRLGGIPDAATRLSRWGGRLRFAGAELDDSFVGSVEGAIRSGRRAARLIAEDLASGSSAPPCRAEMTEGATL
ncbi:MAG: FAD-dependent oxidoreductase [Pseudomonadota bacterium]